MYPAGKAFHLAAQGDNRQVIVRVTVNDNIILTGEHLQRLTVKSDVCTQAVTIGNTCAKQLTLETLVPDTLTPQTLKNAKFFIEIGFLGVTNAVNQIDTQLYVNEILGYLYQVNQSAELTFSLVGDDLFVFNEIEGVAFRLRDGKVFAEPAPGVDVAAATFWVPMGVYYTDKVSTKNDYLTAEITAFDGMGLIERISSDPVRIPTGRTADYRLSEIATQAGLTAVFPSDLSTYPNATTNLPRMVYTAKNYREIVGYLAAFIGCNAHFDRLGRLTVKAFESVDFSIPRDQQYLKGLEKTQDSTLTIASLKVTSPQSSSDLETPVSTFYRGWINGSTGALNPRQDANGRKYFYSGEISGLLPNTTYSIRRTKSEVTDRTGTAVPIGSVSLFFYGAQNEYLGEDKICADFEGDRVISAKGVTGNFRITSQNVAYIRIQQNGGNYTTDGAGNILIDNTYTITRVVGEGGTISAGANYGMEISNPYLYNQTLVNEVFSFVQGTAFQPCKVKYRGDPTLDVGDIITAEDRSGSLVNLIVTSETFNIGGGMNSEILCEGQTNSTTSISGSYSNNTPTVTQRIERLAEEFSKASLQMTGISGGYVKFVYDEYDKPRAIAITETDVPVTWDSNSGRVKCTSSVNMWAWSNNGFAHSSDGGTTYADVSITMDGKVIAQIVEAAVGNIGGWGITEDALYIPYMDSGVQRYAVIKTSGNIVFAVGSDSYTGDGDSKFCVYRNGNMRMKNAGIRTSDKAGNDVGAIVLTDDGFNGDYGVFFGCQSNRPGTSTPTNMTTYLRGTTVRIYDHGGGVYKGTSGSDVITSDRTFKDEYELPENYLDFFRKLNPILYQYKGNNHHRKHVGFIAQDVEQALAESQINAEDFAGLVKMHDFEIPADESGESESKTYETLYGLRYEEFIALNTMYIKHLEKRIERLEEMLNSRS